MIEIPAWHLVPATVSFEPGHKIPQGWHGQQIELGKKSAEHAQREPIYEAVRQRLPQSESYPSRLTASFAFRHRATAEAWRQIMFPRSTLYEVSAIARKFFEGNILCVGIPGGYSETMEEMAEHYWRKTRNFNLKDYPEIEWNELVVDGPLIVVRRVDPFN